jgi:hypothetical protein
MVDALRKGSMSSMEGQMIGKHYVAPGIGQAIAQLGQGYMASKAQGGVDEQARKMNATQAERLNDLRRRRRGMPGMPEQQTNEDPYARFSYGNEA